MDTAGITNTSGGAAQADVLTPRQRELKTAAGEVVGIAFFGQMLKTMRSSTLKGKYGHGGRGEEIFQAQLDEFLSKKMGASAGTGLGEAIYKRFSGFVQ